LYRTNLRVSEGGARCYLFKTRGENATQLVAEYRFRTAISVRSNLRSRLRAPSAEL
jgi:hypothetical protein